MTTITPFLWFNGRAEEAMQVYVSIFKDATVVQVSRTGAAPDAPVMAVTFELQGQRFIGLNAGPEYTFTPAVSFFVSVETQPEVDELWGKLLAGGGSEDRRGWLKDRFGLSWQVIPTALGRMLGDKDRGRAERATQAMLTMHKIDIAALQRAFDGA